MNDLNLRMTDEERAYLANLVDTDLRETRVESRRTDTPDYQADLHHKEEMIRGLLAKLRATTAVV